MESAEIRRKIQALMETVGWSEYKLAKMAGLPQSTISHLFKKNNAPTFPTVAAICKAFNITMAQFFADEGEAVVLTSEQQKLLISWGAITEPQRAIIASTMDQFIQK